MAQERTLLQHTSDLTVERVRLHVSSPQWSPHYEVATRRLVLPASGATEFRLADRTVLLDGLTALCLPTGQPYQMKPCTSAARSSIVVSERPGGADALLPPDTWQLTPRALWQLRRHWRALAAGTESCAGTTQALLQSLLPPSLDTLRMPEQGLQGKAVQRVRRFMVERTAAMDNTPWTLHDVADAACCSLYHLARLFRRHTGLSLHGYRQRLRLATALQRLEEGERNLAALAHELGYSSQSHLGSTFLRELGVTPAQARRELAA